MEYPASHSISNHLCLCRMAEKKREAEAAIDLMKVQYERTRSEEERRDGLIIVKAIYGKIENDRFIEGK